MYRYLFIIALLAITIPAKAELDYAKVSSPVELRAIWVNADAIPKTEQGIRNLVRSYHKANLNVLLPEVIARGYTVYPSKLLARDPRFAGAIDPLPIMISEAHSLGMEVHPWVWVFRAGYTKDRGGILTAHPDWVELSKYGEDLSANGGLWVSPTIPAARDFLANLFCELVRKYDVDGLHLDYIRYEVQSPTPYGYSKCARDTFKMLYGTDPVDIDRLSYNQIYWNMFRERQVNTFVQRISRQTRAIKPNLVISAAVGSDITTARLNLLQNWGNWVDNRWVDFITPMAYTNNDNGFAALVSGQESVVGNKTILAPGIGLHMQQSNPDQTNRQVGIARKEKALGEALFASSYFGEPQTSALIQGAYACPASVPYRAPADKAKVLTTCAQNAKQAGDNDFASYLDSLAVCLSQYNTYKTTATPYISPSQPPIEIPENVIPLPSAQVTPAASPIKIDGALDDPAWANAARVQLAYNPNGGPAPVQTTAMLTYDDTNLYVAFDASEPMMSKLKATVVKRDGPTFYDDSVEVFVDPTDKRREYYHLSTNTLGTRFDQKVMNPGWNGEWNTASKLGANGWTTEIAIPFTALKASKPIPGTRWAINLTRNRAASGSLQYFTWAVPYGSFHSPDRLGMISFM